MVGEELGRSVLKDSQACSCDAPGYLETLSCETLGLPHAERPRASGGLDHPDEEAAILGKPQCTAA